MKTIIKLFAKARDLVGTAEVELDLPESATVADLRSALGEHSPALRLLLPSLLVRQASWGNGPVCTSVSGNDATIFSRPVAVPGLAPGAHASLGSVTICTNHPKAALRLAGLLVAWL